MRRLLVAVVLALVAALAVPGWGIPVAFLGVAAVVGMGVARAV